MVLPTVELVPLRTNPDTGQTEVLLTQRPAGDIWAGEWHVPGAAVIATDKASVEPGEGNQFGDAFGRLLGSNGELKAGVTPTHWPPRELRPELRMTRRGPEVSIVHFVEVDGEPKVGVFVPVGESVEAAAPSKVISQHVKFINDAARAYEAQRATQP